jgi:hypothetical protein
MVKNDGGGLKPDFRTNRRHGSPDEFYVFYARGPIAKLVEIVEKSVDDNPKVYKRLEAELPMEVPGNSFAISNSPNDRDANSDVVKESGEAQSPGTDQTVADEANLTVNLFANRNGLMVERLEEAAEGQQFARRSMKSAMAGNKDARNEESSRAAKQTDANFEASKKLPNVANATSDKTYQDPAARQAPGYSYFHVAVDNNQRQLTQKKAESVQAQAAPQQNEAFPLASQTPGIGNTFNPFTANTLNNANGGFQQRGNYARGQQQQQMARNAVPREPQLGRMLIVLKSEQSAAEPQP